MEWRLGARFLNIERKVKRVLEFWLYLGVRTCEVFLRFMAILFLGSNVLTLIHFACFFLVLPHS